MSLATWKAEFYPVEAAETESDDAAAHSLQKWEGLRPVAIERHGIKLDCGDLIDGPDDEACFSIGSSNCALCVQFEDLAAEDPCHECPLSIARSGIACTLLRDDEAVSPWRAWVRNGDPEPMIHWLKVTVEQQGGAS